jgi:hypothetical protein
VTCWSAKGCIAVGSVDAGRRGVVPMNAHWDGTSWHTEQVAAVGASGDSEFTGVLRRTRLMPCGR